MVIAAVRSESEGDPTEQVWATLRQVPDPEIPVISVVDLGIVRYVRWGNAGETNEAVKAWVSVSDDGERPNVPARGAPLGAALGANEDVAKNLRVGLTPTYSGCPATEVIRKSVKDALIHAGYENIVIEDVLSPPWSSDWITDDGRRKLQAYGITPPAESVSNPRRLLSPLVIACPRCASRNTERLSEFGSTPCKAHYRCVACLKPFDYFKCI